MRRVSVTSLFAQTVIVIARRESDRRTETRMYNSLLLSCYCNIERRTISVTSPWWRALPLATCWTDITDLYRRDFLRAENLLTYRRDFRFQSTPGHERPCTHARAHTHTYGTYSYTHEAGQRREPHGGIPEPNISDAINHLITRTSSTDISIIERHTYRNSSKDILDRNSSSRRAGL